MKKRHTVKGPAPKARNPFAAAVTRIMPRIVKSKKSYSRKRKTNKKENNYE